MTREIYDLAPFLDLELAESIKAMPAWSLTPESLPFLREFSIVESLPSPQGYTIDDCEVPGSSGTHKIPVRIYRSTALNDAAPVLIWMHGGGFVMGNVPKDDDLCLGMAQAGHCVVVSVGYRLAPEHPFPAAPEDCYAVLEWVAQKPAELGAGVSQVAVGGVSAGGCLAAAVALMARDRKGPELCHQFLLIPVTDDRLKTLSSQRIRDLRVWDAETAKVSWRMYLGDTQNDDTSPYAAPNRAEDLSCLPPATILVEDFDVLHDEAIEYAGKLSDAGVTTDLKVYPGTFHGHFAFAPDAAISKRTVDDIFTAVHKTLSA